MSRVYFSDYATAILVYIFIYEGDSARDRVFVVHPVVRESSRRDVVEKISLEPPYRPRGRRIVTLARRRRLQC